MTTPEERPHRVYITPAVIRMVGEALGIEANALTVYNMSRPGKVLARARINNGIFDAFHTQKALRKMRRFKLAARLGRISPRYDGLDPEMEVECLYCSSFAVKWGDKWLCENGHTGDIS